MTIDRALSIFKNSSYTTLKIGNKSMNVIIDSYADYKDGILLIPAHASILPDSSLYFVSGNGTIKEISPLKIAMDKNVGPVHRIKT